MSGGVRDVLIEDCQMLNLSGPILSYRWTEHRGGVVRNISAKNIRVEGKSNGVGSPDARAVMWVQSNYGCNDVYSKSCWASDGRVKTRAERNKQKKQIKKSEPFAWGWLVRWRIKAKHGAGE